MMLYKSLLCYMLENKTTNLHNDTSNDALEEVLFELQVLKLT